MQTDIGSVCRILGLLVAASAWQTASAVDVSWTGRPGSAVGITSHVSGLVYILGTDGPMAYAYNVYKWNGKEFVKMSSSPGRRIAVTSSDQLWMVNNVSDLAVQQPGSSNAISLGNAIDVAVGGDNSVWIIGTDQRAGGFGVYKRNANDWTYANLGAKRIAVDKGGNPWVVNDTGEIYMYNAASKLWERKAGVKARSVHTGASSGAVWMLAADGVLGGYPIYQWNSSKQVWEPYGNYAAVEITEAAGVPWIVQSDGSIYSKTPPATTSTTTGDTTQTWPPPTAQDRPPLRVTETGKLLCSGTAYTDCGKTKADYVGKYALDTSCDSGFYDPIYGGSCWKCPDDDGSGAWIRSLDAVDKDTACWRSPKESTGSATKVKSPAWAWDCPAGSFWDGYSPDGLGGSCWTCPAERPRRTAAAVWASNACATALNQTAGANFLTFNGCPKPDVTTMNLPGKRSPGKPFLDIASGWSQSVAAGGCFACPISDEAGNFLITDRNTNPVYDVDYNTGCTVKLKWQPAPFYEPGLAYMQGVKDMIWDSKVFDGDKISAFLYDLAEAKGLGDATPEAKAWVTARWQEIANNPYNSDTMRAYMFALLKTALKKEAAQRTAAEKKFIDSFAKYIQERRTYLADQALRMYDSWKAYDDAYRQQTGQSRSLSTLFYYGTVPLDFHGTLKGLIGVGALGGSTAGSLVALNQYVKGIEYVLDTSEDALGWVRTRASEMANILDDIKLLKTVQGFSIVSGATIVQAGFAILTSIAIDQFIAIETARPKLEAAMARAKEPVDLNQLEKAENGADMMYLFWSKAMDTTGPEDFQVVQLATTAHARAAQGGYIAPPKGTYNTSGRTVTDRVSSGTTAGFLNQDQKLISKNGKYKLVMQSDGNLVIYTSSGQAIWATGTNGKGSAPFKLAMQSDSNLVIYANGSATWATGIRGQTAPFTLVMEDDGKLRIYDKSNVAIWER